MLKRLYLALVALLGLCGAVALGNYTMTQGAGTNFGSIVVSTVHYAQQLLCDPTTPANCSAVKAGNTAAASDVAQVVSDPNLLAAVNAAIPTGGNSIGSVGSDPSKGPASPSSVAINASSATTTQLVAISGSTSIYVTSFDVISGGTGNVTFVYGTGSSCGTGTTSLTGPYPLTAQAGIAKGSGVGTILKVPSGNALCVTTSAAVQVSGSVSYQQF